MHFEKIPGYITTHLRCLSPPVHRILPPIKLPTPQTDSRDVQIRPWQSDTLSSHVGEVKVKAIFVKSSRTQTNSLPLQSPLSPHLNLPTIDAPYVTLRIYMVYTLYATSIYNM